MALVAALASSRRCQRAEIETLLSVFESDELNQRLMACSNATNQIEAQEWWIDTITHVMCSSADCALVVQAYGGIGFPDCSVAAPGGVETTLTEAFAEPLRHMHREWIRICGDPNSSTTLRRLSLLPVLLIACVLIFN